MADFGGVFFFADQQLVLDLTGSVNTPSTSEPSTLGLIGLGLLGLGAMKRRRRYS
jgi:PEP-CTERM motif